MVELLPRGGVQDDIGLQGIALQAAPALTAAAVRSRRTSWPAMGPVAISSWMEAAA
jgi:hypothetical protein